ncbi:MAG: amino-acid N-acetyltransferase [Spirochaetaceae bacterium]|jgi:amino-acid N-acetyltransferase|nr:amino-acid N-acetyltransferase [Spirochaetaceae bacterium]
MSISRAQAEESQVDRIREAFHYQSRFKGSTMVFKIDFPVTEDPAFPYLVRDLALLARTGFRVVIVPGAKEWIDAVLREYGIRSKYAETTRITTGAAMPFVEMAAFHVAARFMTGLSADRVDAVTGNFVRARGLGVVDGLDMEQTGRVDKVFIDSLGRVLNLGMVPILPCIGWSPAGRSYNVPSDEIALSVSAALGAVKLFIVSVHGGIRTGAYAIPDNVETEETGRVIRLSPQEAELLLAANTPGPNPAETNPVGEDKALTELDLALRASRAGVERVHIIDGREQGAILRELFSNLGAGTMVHADEYESIRTLKNDDIPDVLRLMEPLMQQGLLIRRGSEDIREKKNDYAVFEIDGSIHACGALHNWGEAQGEIAAIATDPAYTDMGLGSRIVRFLLGEAKKQGLRRVFVLTTRTHDWFEFLGFKECSAESLPEQRRRQYDSKRKSKVFALDIR